MATPANETMERSNAVADAATDQAKDGAKSAALGVISGDNAAPVYADRIICATPCGDFIAQGCACCVCCEGMNCFMICPKEWKCCDPVAKCCESCNPVCSKCSVYLSAPCDIVSATAIRTGARRASCTTATRFADHFTPRRLTHLTRSLHAALFACLQISAMPAIALCCPTCGCSLLCLMCNPNLAVKILPPVLEKCNPMISSPQCQGCGLSTFNMCGAPSLGVEVNGKLNWVCCQVDGFKMPNIELDTNMCSGFLCISGLPCMRPSRMGLGIAYPMMPFLSFLTCAMSASEKLWWRKRGASLAPTVAPA